MDTWRQFARTLFETKDADPGYYALAESGMSTSQQMRAMVAWCAYYNLAYAAVASEKTGAAFWDYLDSLYPTAKRATERRHFRGAAGLKALAAWRTAYPQPERMVESCFGPTFHDVRRKVGAVPQMGDYFIWKFADVQERVFNVPCSFEGADGYVPKTPRQGAELILAAEGLHKDAEDLWLPHVHGRIISHMRAVHVPPRYDRVFNLQEAETVCCVFKQYMNGSYRYGLRSAKSMMRLRMVAGTCRTARAMLATLTDDGSLTPTLEAIFNAGISPRH